MKKLFLIMITFCFVNVYSQTISPQVINSAGGGGQVGSTGVEVYYNIGETMVITVGNGTNFITQGFLQPDVVGVFGLVSTPFMSPNTCVDKTDGSIRIVSNISGVANQSDYSYTYTWSQSSLCPTNDCSGVDSLAAGNYSVLVVAHHVTDPNLNDTAKVTNIIISGSSEPCQINIFTGISPNGDGSNDYFFISDIEQFPGNRVEIYNRWGQKLFETQNYNNRDNHWEGTVKGGSEVAPSGTYFYIIDLNNGSKPIKGWLELTSGN